MVSHPTVVLGFSSCNERQSSPDRRNVTRYPCTLNPWYRVLILFCFSPYPLFTSSSDPPELTSPDVMINTLMCSLIHLEHTIPMPNSLCLLWLRHTSKLARSIPIAKLRSLQSRRCPSTWTQTSIQAHSARTRTPRISRCSTRSSHPIGRRQKRLVQ